MDNAKEMALKKASEIAFYAAKNNADYAAKNNAEMIKIGFDEGYNYGLGEKGWNCTWVYDDDDCFWATSCNEVFYLIDDNNEGEPSDQRIKFCGFCGGIIYEVNNNCKK